MKEHAKLALWSAALFACSFAPLNLWPTVFFALIPLLWVCDQGNRRLATQAGFWFGFVTYLFQMQFIFVLLNKWVGSPIIATLLWLACGAGGGAYFALFTWVAGSTRKFSAIAWPLAWCGLELLRSYIPLIAFPWALIATPLIHAPALAWTGRWLTVFGVGILVFGVNMVGLRVAQGQPPKTYRWPAAGLALSFLLGLFLSPSPIKPPKGTAVVQVGRDVGFSGLDPAQLGAIVAPLVAAAEQKGASWIMLPEGMAKVPASLTINPLGLASTLPLVMGVQTGEPIHQGAALYDRGQVSYAFKNRLVVFGEYVPFRSQLPWLASAFGLPSKDILPGEGPKILAVQAQQGTVKLGPLICFEALYPDLARQQASQGADLIAILSMDDWFTGTYACDQLRDSGRWRALETGLPMARSAPIGYTVLCDSRGKILQQAPYGQPAFLVQK